jgi:CheY-like chemotaxis protein
LEVRKKARVLVVEDEESVRQALSRILENFGHDTVLAKDAVEGLAKFKESGNFDIILTDLSLPGPSGLDLAANAKALRPEIPVILLSGWDISEKELKGAVEMVMSKPVKIKDMLDAIDKLVWKDTEE